MLWQTSKKTTGRLGPTDRRTHTNILAPWRRARGATLEAMALTLDLALTRGEVEPQVLRLPAFLAHPGLGIRRYLATGVFMRQALSVLAHIELIVGYPLTHLPPWNNDKTASLQSRGYPQSVLLWLS